MSAPATTVRAVFFDVDFTLIPAVQISGWIDFGEEPLEGLEVVVIRRADGQAEARQKPDAQGRFHFEGLYPEAYEVVLKRAGHEYTRIPVTAAGAAGLVLDVRSSD